MAQQLGADDIVFFAKDVDVGAFLPAIGFPKTFRDGRGWQTFLAAVATGGPDAIDLLCPYTQTVKPALAVVGDEGSVAVLIGGQPARAALSELVTAMPVLMALFRSERAVTSKTAYATLAERSSEKAEALAASLALSQTELHRVMGFLQQSEEWLSIVLRSIGDAVITTDAAGCVTYLNPMAEGLTGWTLAEVKGRLLHEVFRVVHESSRVVVESPVEQVLRTGATVSLARDKLLLQKGDDEVAIDDSAAPLRNSQGVLTGVVLVFRDITEQRTAERARATLVDELQRVVQANELFAGILGHDLRSPLSSIMMGAELLRKTEDTKQRATAHRILRSGARMGRMISQLLDFTRVRTGITLALSKQPTDLGELSRHSVAELEVAHPEWSFSVARLGNVEGFWDPDRLSQVLSNLLGNAVEHGVPSGGVQIRIDGRDAAEVVVDVHNDGAIPFDVLPHLFDPFRSGRAGRERSQGLGLGLFITRQIVEGHGGETEVSSTAATGTTFRLHLPRGGRPSMVTTDRADAFVSKPAVPHR